MLQNVLFNHNEHLCGLNPKAFRYLAFYFDFFKTNFSLSFSYFYRTIKSARKTQSNPARCVVDGELIWSYLNLPLTEKLEVARKIGTKIEEICSDLIEIDRITAVL